MEKEKKCAWRTNDQQQEAHIIKRENNLNKINSDLKSGKVRGSKLIIKSIKQLAHLQEKGGRLDPICKQHHQKKKKQI